MLKPSTPLALLLLVSLSAPAVAEDWPQWRGAERDAVWKETGIVETLPAELKVAWRTPIRSGYAGPAVADGRVFVTDWQKDPDSRTLDGRERLMALDEQTGEVLWAHEWQTSYRMLMASYAIGPRATPTVDGDRIYVLGATGRLLCLDVASGEVRWEKDYPTEYDTSIATWGTTSPPLVDGDLLIAVVGAEPDGMVMAFDKRTGEERWRSVEVEGEMGYSAPVIYEAGGARQLVVWHATALVSLNPANGDLYWQQPIDAGAGMAITTPLKSGDYLLVSQLYNGSTMMRLDRDRPAATLLWQGQGRSPDTPEGLHTTNSTPIIVGDHLYGIGVNGELRGLDARTGERVWENLEMNAEARAEWGVLRWSTAFLVQQGDRWFFNSDDGYLIQARFSPEGYEELGRTKLIEPTTSAGFGSGARRRFDRPVNWSHPAYANRHIVHRNDREIIRSSLAAAHYP